MNDNYFIIHGSFGSPFGNWFSWLYDFISENNILTSLSLNVYYIYSMKRPITNYKPIKYSDDFHDFNISFYSIWFKHLIISTHFKNIFNKTPILSTYSVAKPFTWEIELGYNF